MALHKYRVQWCRCSETKKNPQKTHKQVIIDKGMVWVMKHTPVGYTQILHDSTVRCIISHAHRALSVMKSGWKHELKEMNPFLKFRSTCAN